MNFLSRKDDAGVDNPEVKISFMDLCLRCDTGNNLLVCKEIGCPVAVHEECLGCPARFDEAGRFHCPYCSYKHTLQGFAIAERNAVLAEKMLSNFLEEKWVDAEPENKIVGEVKTMERIGVFDESDVETEDCIKEVTAPECSRSILQLKEADKLLEMKPSVVSLMEVGDNVGLNDEVNDGVSNIVGNDGVSNIVGLNDEVNDVDNRVIVVEEQSGAVVVWGADGRMNVDDNDGLNDGLNDGDNHTIVVAEQLETAVVCGADGRMKVGENVCLNDEVNNADNQTIVFEGQLETDDVCGDDGWLKVGGDNVGLNDEVYDGDKQMIVFEEQPDTVVCEVDDECFTEEDMIDHCPLSERLQSTNKRQVDVTQTEKVVEDQQEAENLSASYVKELKAPDDAVHISAQEYQLNVEAVGKNEGRIAEKTYQEQAQTTTPSSEKKRRNKFPVKK